MPLDANFAISMEKVYAKSGMAPLRDRVLMVPDTKTCRSSQQKDRYIHVSDGMLGG